MFFPTFSISSLSFLSLSFSNAPFFLFLPILSSSSSRRFQEPTRSLHLSPEQNRHPSSSADSATGGVCLECSPRRVFFFFFFFFTSPLLTFKFSSLRRLSSFFPSPFWNILVLLSLPHTRICQANPLRFIPCKVVRLLTQTQLTLSLYYLPPSLPPLSLSLSLALLATIINILVRDSCTAPTADHIADIVKVSIICGTALRIARFFFSVAEIFSFHWRFYKNSFLGVDAQIC